eukprot:8245520-Heterocapsa_arctica.AAC.1
MLAVIDHPLPGEATGWLFHIGRDGPVDIQRAPRLAPDPIDQLVRGKAYIEAIPTCVVKQDASDVIPP